VINTVDTSHEDMIVSVRGRPLEAGARPPPGGPSAGQRAVRLPAVRGRTPSLCCADGKTQLPGEGEMV